MPPHVHRLISWLHWSFKLRRDWIHDKAKIDNYIYAASHRLIAELMKQMHPSHRDITPKRN